MIVMGQSGLRGNGGAKITPKAGAVLVNVCPPPKPNPHNSTSQIDLA